MTPPRDPELTLLHVHSKSMGYGRYGSYLYDNLQRLGLTVYDEMADSPLRPREQAPPSAIPHLDDFVSAAQFRGRNLPTSPTNVIAWVSVPTHARGWHEGQYAVISTMWESALLPEAFRDTLHEFELVIVPSQQNVDLFSQYHPNVKLVPLGVDPELWHYLPRPDPDPFFRFLIAGSGSRKGTDLAHRAFHTVFRTPPKSGPIPRLVMKNPKNEQSYIYNTYQFHFQTADTELITGKMSAQAEVNLYASCHAYIQPSRGEGFGLQPLQAIAQGLPTILTNAHGQAGYAQLGIPISSTMAKTDYFMYGDAGEWWEPDFDELCEAIYDVYTNYPTHKAAAAASSAIVETNWTWANTATQFVDAIGYDRLTRPGPGPRAAWHQPEARLYLTITDQDYHGEIAGRSFYFRKGESYYETADVKRILFEGEKLDPACLLDDDLGLVPEQIERLGLYQASKEYCPTCHQRMNTVPTKADDIMAGVIQ